MDGGWMPLPTRLQRYCDPASLVFIVSIIVSISLISYFSIFISISYIFFVSIFITISFGFYVFNIASYWMSSPLLHQSPLNAAHNGPAFAAWHRNFMLLFETRMKKLLNDSSFAMPYWECTGQTTCQVSQ